MYFKKEHAKINAKGGITFGKHPNGRKKWVKLKPLKYNEFVELDANYPEGNNFEI